MRLRFSVALAAALFLMDGCKSNNTAGVQSATAPAPAGGSVSLTDVAPNIINWEQVPGSELPSPKQYQLNLFPTANVDGVLEVGTGAQGIPHTMDGIWWTDGDTLPIKALTLAHASWDNNSHVAVLPVFDAGSYTYLGNSSGANFFQIMLAFHLVYEIDFSSDLQSAQIIPVVAVLGHFVKVPSWLAKFTMTYSDDGLWMRQSSFLGQQVPDYRFTRIVRGDGTRDETHNNAYDRYVADSLVNSYVVAPQGVGLPANVPAPAPAPVPSP